MNAVATEVARQNPTHVRRILGRAMHDADNWAIRFVYSDKNGVKTVRHVSPIRFASADRFLALCLSREEPRQFYLSRCSDFVLVSAAELLMPVPIQTLVESPSIA